MPRTWRTGLFLAALSLLGAFLLKFLRLSNRSSDSDSAPKPLNEEATVARFIYRSKQYSGRRPTAAAFEPEEYQGRWELSVCHRDMCSLDRVWEIALRPRSDGKCAVAIVDLPLAAALEHGLAGLPEPSTFPEHAVLVGWPAEKEARKRIQVGLAKRSGDCYLPAATLGAA